MIVKILKASGGFQGIDYNDRKTKNGKGELLEARNFGLLEMKEGHIYKEEYIAFMEMYSSSNARIKNKQFHAVISCKGKEYSQEQLKELGIQYLAKMGYDKNPYLIYFHSDTDNNHVHVVSTRVDENGLKINDSFEKVRSQTAMKEILALNPAMEYQTDMEKAFSYSFSTEAQFKLLLEKMGYQTKEVGNSLEIIKYRTVQGEINKQEIANSIQNRASNPERIKQVTALFNKYKGVYPSSLVWLPNPLPGGLESKMEGKLQSPFSEAMGKKFGLELVFHSKEGKVPYGYTILDHPAKQVYKGVQIMSLGDLLKSVPQQGKLENLTTLISETVDNKAGYRALKELLKINGFSMDGQGQIRFKGGKENVFKLLPEDVKQLKYQDRLMDASAYQVSTKKERYIIAQQYGVLIRDILLQEKDKHQQSHLEEMVNSILQTSGNLKERFAQFSLQVVTLGDEIFILDKRNAQLLNIADLHSQELQEELKEVLDSLEVLVIPETEDFNKPSDEWLARQPEKTTYEDSENLSSHSLTQKLEGLFGSITDDPEESRKKRKR